MSDDTPTESRSAASKPRGTAIWISLAINAILLGLLGFASSMNSQHVRRASDLGDGNFVIAENLHFSDLDSRIVRIFTTASPDSVDHVDGWTILTHGLDFPAGREVESVNHFVQVNHDLVLGFVCVAIQQGNPSLAKTILNRMDPSQIWSAQTAQACRALLEGDKRQALILRRFDDDYRKSLAFYEATATAESESRRPLFYTTGSEIHTTTDASETE